MAYEVTVTHWEKGYQKTTSFGPAEGWLAMDHFNELCTKNPLDEITLSDTSEGVTIKTRGKLVSTI